MLLISTCDLFSDKPLRSHKANGIMQKSDGYKKMFRLARTLKKISLLLLRSLQKCQENK